MMSFFQKIQKIILFSMIFVFVASAMEAPDTIKLLVRLNYQQQEPATAREETKSGSFIGRTGARLGSGIRSLRTLGGVQRIEIEGGKKRRLGPILDKQLERRGCPTFYISSPGIDKTMTMEAVYKRLKDEPLMVNCLQKGIKVELVTLEATFNLPHQVRGPRAGRPITIIGDESELIKEVIEKKMNELKLLPCKIFYIDHPIITIQHTMKQVEQILYNTSSQLHINCWKKIEEKEQEKKARNLELSVKITYPLRGIRQEISEKTVQKEDISDITISGKRKETIRALLNRLGRIDRYKNCEFVIENYEITEDTRLDVALKLLKGNMLGLSCFPKKSMREWERFGNFLKIYVFVDGQQSSMKLSITPDNKKLRKFLKSLGVCKDIATIQIRSGNQVYPYNRDIMLDQTIAQIKDMMTNDDMILEVYCSASEVQK
jgi:hypothetical protein